MTEEYELAALTREGCIVTYPRTPPQKK